MTARIAWALVPLLAVATPAPAQGPERVAMALVRLTTDPALTRDCAQLGSVEDDSIKDLRRKIVGVGGDTALLMFGIQDMSRIYAQVFRGSPPVAPPPGPAPPPPPR